MSYDRCRINKTKNSVGFLFIDIIQYLKYEIIEISNFSFFSQILGPKMGFNDPHPLEPIKFRMHPILSSANAHET